MKKIVFAIALLIGAMPAMADKHGRDKVDKNCGQMANQQGVKGKERSEFMKDCHAKNKHEDEDREEKHGKRDHPDWKKGGQVAAPVQSNPQPVQAQTPAAAPSTPSPQPSANPAPPPAPPASQQGTTAAPNAGQPPQKQAQAKPMSIDEKRAQCSQKADQANLKLVFRDRSIKDCMAR